MTTIEKGTPRLRADFNSVRDGETLVGTFVFAGDAYVLPDLGERVEVYDPEGNRCFGEVTERLDDETFRVRLDYETWQDATDEVGGPVVELMEALRRSIFEARARGVDSKQEDVVDDFHVTAA